jgi:hypothetical protein
MRLHRIKLHNFRGVAGVEVVFMPTGVTLVTGANEIGKSSLIDAFDLLLQQKDSAKRTEIRDAKPEQRDASPTVEADFSFGPYHVIYAKRWLKGNQTKLEFKTPSRTPLTGDDAHNWMDENLKQHVDLALFRGIRVIQGEGTKLPELQGATQLQTILDAGAAGLGASADALLDLVEAEYRRYWTETGLPSKGPHTALPGELKELQGALATATEKLRGAERDVEALQDTERRLTEEAPQLAELVKTRDSVAIELSDARGRIAEIDEATQQSKAAHELRGSYQSQVEDRHRRELALAKDAGALSGEKETLARLDEQIHSAEAMWTADQAVLAKSEEALHIHDEGAAVVLKDLEAREGEYSLVLLKERAAKVRSATTKRAQAKAEVAANPIDEKKLKRLNDLAQKVAEANAQLRLGSPTATVSSSKKTDVEIDGAATELVPSKATEITVQKRAVVKVGSVRIEIRAGTSLEDLQAAAAKAEGTWRETLAETGCSDLEGAAAMGARRKETSALVDRAEEQIADALRSDQEDGFASLEELDHKVAEIGSRYSAYWANRTATTKPPKTKEEARQASEAHGAMRDDIEREFRKAKKKTEATLKLLEGVQMEHDEVKSRVDTSTGRLQAGQMALVGIRAEISDADLSKRLATATAACDDADSKLERLNEKAQRSNLSALEARAKSTSNAATKAQKISEGLATTANELRGRVQLQSEQGLFDQVQRVETRLAAKQAEWDNLSKRAMAAKLLYDSLIKHRAAAQARYVGPLRTRIEEMGRLLFGSSFGAEILPNLSFGKITKDGLSMEFDRWSTGTKEQLSTIARLAAGQAAAEKDRGVPVLFDDILGFTDPERLERMGAVLDMAAAKAQVVILTSFPGRYKHVGSREEFSMTTALRPAGEMKTILS